jgi:phosphate transport system substrate-binding protein
MRGVNFAGFLKIAILIALVGSLADLSPRVSEAAQRAHVAVLVHPDTPVDDLPLAEVRKLFTGEKRYWTAEMPVVLVIRAPEARERAVVLGNIYRMTESQFKQYWIGKIFRGEAVSAPKIVYSNDMSRQLVAVVPGAIAFVSAEEAGPGVKVLKVDGHLPGDPGYPLQ